VSIFRPRPVLCSMVKWIVVDCGWKTLGALVSCGREQLSPACGCCTMTTAMRTSPATPWIVITLMMRKLSRRNYHHIPRRCCVVRGVLLLLLLLLLLVHPVGRSSGRRYDLVGPVIRLGIDTRSNRFDTLRQSRWRSGFELGRSVGSLDTESLDSLVLRGPKWSLRTGASVSVVPYGVNTIPNHDNRGGHHPRCHHPRRRAGEYRSSPGRGIVCGSPSVLRPYTR